MIANEQPDIVCLNETKCQEQHTKIFDVLPFKTAADDCKPLPEVSAVTVVMAFVALMPNKALVPPIPADEADATPSTIANLPISFYYFYQGYLSLGPDKIVYLK